MRPHPTIVLAFVALSATIQAAGDWPQWRGPARDGVAPSASPAEWPKAIARGWQVDVGEGYASPVAAGDRVYAFGRRDPDEIITAVNLKTGAIEWQQRYAAEFARNQYARQMAKGPHATPLVAGGRLFTLGVTGVLTAWDAAAGARLWMRDYSPLVDTSRLFCGTAGSPLLEAGALVVQVGSDVHGGRIIALDPATGRERWTWTGKGPGYASPVALTLDGVRQIVALTNSSVEGLDAATGASLWSFPFPDEWHENIVTPVWTGTHVVVSGPRQGTHALHVRRAGERFEASAAWTNRDVTMYMSTPVALEGVIYGHSSKRKGQLVALDASTGRLLWSTDGREGEAATVLAVGGHVVFLTNAGDLVVVRRSEDPREERRYGLEGGQVWAIPIWLPDGLIAREPSTLVRLSFIP